jgi:PAS domain S-box-containing protein
MSKPIPPALQRYGLAVLLSLLALLLTLLLKEALALSLSTLFFASVAISAWYGGLWPALLATVLAILAIDLFLMLPANSLSTGLDEIVYSIVFTSVAVLISSLTRARSQAEEALDMGEQRLGLALQAGSMGTWDWDILTGDIRSSGNLERLYGLEPGALGRTLKGFLKTIHSEDRGLVMQAATRAIDQKTAYEAEFRVICPDGSVRWKLVRGQAFYDGSGKPVRMLGVGMDITERKRAEQALARHTGELARSNADLEQFAYVASHDLQEPLRMVTLYTQLLAKRYQGRLDGNADEFIAFIRDGVQRMQGLIGDLLAYSRVGRSDQLLKPTNCEEVLSHVLGNLRATILAAGAQVSYDPLPTLIADHFQLEQLLQNLLSNALKFHGEESPRIHLSARQQASIWVFSIRDNGIGIDPQFAERIFVIFQRLHGNEAYPGTGIGLAICKKIVERHGGRIWVESEPGRGATFHFTLQNKKESLHYTAGEGA